MKFDIHVKNIKNMKLNGQIFKIHKKKIYIYIYIYEKFKEFLTKLVWRETLFFCFQDTNKVKPPTLTKSNHCGWLDKKLMLLPFQLKKMFYITIEQNIIQSFQQKWPEWWLHATFSKAWFFQLVGLSKSLQFCFRYADTTCSKLVIKIIIEFYIYGSHRQPTTTFWSVRQP